MFDRFIRLAKARKALRDRRFEEVLGLTADTLIRDDRRAERLRLAAAAALLQRAERHLADGDVAAARAEAKRVAAQAPGAEVEDLLRRLDEAAAGQVEAADLARRCFAEVRKLAERGETAAAAALLATVDDDPPRLERRQLEKLLRERTQRAAELAAGAATALDGGDTEAAVRLLERARELDRDAAAVAALLPRVAAALAHVAEVAIRERLAADDVLGAAAQLELAQARLPDAGAATFAAPRRRLEAALGSALRAATSLDAAMACVAALRRCGIVAAPPLADLAAAVVATAADPDAAVRLSAAAEKADAPALVRVARDLRAAASADERALVAARRHVEGGALAAARLELVRVLAEHPELEAARRELGLVEQGLADLVARLDGARAALRSGRLREACTAALALVGSDHVGADAHRLVADARERMALVERGIDEVRVALHGRLAAGIEGVRHCLRRLQELAKVQTDHEQLPALTGAVEAEIAAMEQCDAAAAALQAGAFETAAAALAGLEPLVDRLLGGERLEARIAVLADRLVAAGERALAAGELAAVERCAALFGHLRPARPEFARRAEELRTAARRQAAEAERLCAAATAALADRDLAEAERQLDAAEALWRDGDVARRLTAQLDALREQTATLARVEALARDRDFVGAQRKLAAMPPTQALLRTRIYDMKQDLARAQGLDGGFLLRVDEGGEHLVLRGESVTIGNIQKRRADLPVLASLAGRHATVRRSMSFHGGMQDTIVAEDGEVRVGGQPVRSQPLASGDRVQLGPAFQFVYQRPSERSLSAGLVLQGGFQVAGTDRVLLMKDRGRDGRLLLGAGKDVHVRVPRATGEVELYATNGGQMRVFCQGGGTIDGIAFRGEHPVAAGQVVEAAGISFVLYPWQPDA